MRIFSRLDFSTAQTFIPGCPGSPFLPSCPGRPLGPDKPVGPVGPTGPRGPNEPVGVKPMGGKPSTLYQHSRDLATTLGVDLCGG